MNELVQQLLSSIHMYLITGYLNEHNKTTHITDAVMRKSQQNHKVSYHAMGVDHREKVKNEAWVDPLLPLSLSVLLVALGLHVLEAQVILFLLGAGVLLGGNLGVDFGSAKILHVGVGHGVLEGDAELELAINGLIKAVEEAFPSLLVGRSHAVTASSLVDTRENGSLQLVADFDYMIRG